MMIYDIFVSKATIEDMLKMSRMPRITINNMHNLPDNHFSDLFLAEAAYTNILAGSDYSSFKTFMAGNNNGWRINPLGFLSGL